jgi:hypothetical protein
MKHFHVTQGSDEWLRLRMGKPTASEFHRIMTRTKGPSKAETVRGYQIELLTELILDQPLSGVTTASMRHGNAYEATARAAYEMLYGETELCGFLTDDAETYGASPDALVGEDGSVEIKCPAKPAIHVAYMMNHDALIEEYFIQTQGQLFVSGRKWTDLVSYAGGVLPTVTARVYPDAAFQEQLKIGVHSFCAAFTDLVERASALGFLKVTPNVTAWVQASDVDWVRKGREKKRAQGDFDLTDEDISEIWQRSQQNGTGAEVIEEPAPTENPALAVLRSAVIDPGARTK